MQRFTSRAYWVCPKCSSHNSQSIDVPEFSFDVESALELNGEDEIEIQCGECSQTFTGYVFVDSSSAHFQIHEPNSFEFIGDSPYYEPSDDFTYHFESPSDPHSIALENLWHLQKMAGQEGPESDVQFTNRLIFVGAVIALEAYLGDTLINQIVEDSAARDRLLERNSKIGQIQFKAKDFAGKENVVVDAVVQYLRSILYHDLKVVSALYQDATKLNIMPSKDHADILFNAMLLRHDCVHRNGCKKGGERHDVFTDKYTKRFIKTVEQVIDHIEVGVGKMVYF